VSRVADQVLPELKAFQRLTVERAFHRLYEAPHASGRFLVADEVGLGKTMVARGVAAKAIDRFRQKGVKRIDVIYVCSNQVIAKQNISKLMITGEEHDPVLDRVTMLPAHLSDLEKHEINLIPLTPQTSLDLRSNVGARRERVVLWYLLKRILGREFMRSTGARRVLQGPCRTLKSFDWGIRWDPYYWSRRYRLDGALSRRFTDNLKRDRTERGKDSLLGQFRHLAKGLDQKRDRKLVRRANALVGQLRKRLAESCIDGLEPDLIILDEFQRFRNLISPDDPTGELARMLFKQKDARVLLLSATPYKMLTRDVEASEDHHADFLHTVDFLVDHKGDTVEKCKQQLNSMREALQDLPETEADALKAKRSIERLLQPVMCRTERLAVGGDRNGMVMEATPKNLQLRRSDVDGFAALDRVARAVSHPDTIEYWKSAPYPLNFMDEYLLAKGFEKNAPTNKDARLTAGALDVAAVADFQMVDMGNPRMRALAADTVDRGLWKLLWLPPAVPYYRPGTPFSDFEGANPTKRLVFSAWGVVPKAISLLLSYEAERQLVALGDHRRNTAESRKAINQQLRIARKGSEAATMSTFALMFPSTELAELVDPLRRLRESGGELTSIRALLADAERALRPKVRELTKAAKGSGGDPGSWYAAVPLLLEAERVGCKQLASWLRSDDAQRVVTVRGEGSEPLEGREAGDAWVMHLERAAQIVEEPSQLGKPPADLMRMAALVALGSPAIAAVRAINRVAPDAAREVVRLRAMKVADALRGMFNWPEIVPLIRATNRTTRYWEDTLRYCVNGNLQAVLDEYAHVLNEWAPIPGDKTADDYATGVSEAMLDALALHGADFEVRTIGPNGAPTDDHLRMRPRFAVRFADPRASEDKQVDRATNVRASFNSPFWPFVLASTSVGQEGLDFHLYCHAIVHWNLPANPVDFEQREGRVHRYKCHAVRLNLAELHTEDGLHANGADIWEAMFKAATHADGGLRPYWVINEGSTRILRYVPVLPWSRDAERQQQLEKLLASYRLAFGQPRQDDLLAYLGELKLSEEEVSNLVIDLSPPKRRWRRRQ
jgi:Helicase conserved C-terminal domain